MYQATTPCPKCGAQNLRGTWVCAHCGNTLLTYCPHCHASNAPGSRFCQSCGQPMTATGQAQPPSQQYSPPPGYQQQPQQQPYGQYDYQQPYQQPTQQQYQGQYPPDYYQPAPQGGGDIIDKAERFIGAIPDKLKHIAATTNPILLSSLVVLTVGMIIFLVLAFQFGWIKTGATVKKTTVKDTTPLNITQKWVEPGNNKGILINWVTDKPSSSQVQYGVWPNYTTYTPVDNDPTTGINAGVLVHQVGIGNLIPMSTYIYRVISVDKDGNKGMSPDDTFQTLQ